MLISWGFAPVTIMMDLVIKWHVPLLAVTIQRHSVVRSHGSLYGAHVDITVK